MEKDRPTGENHGSESKAGNGQGSGNTERMPDDTNEANQKGAQNEGKDGTKPTASQQQGQGKERANQGSGRTGSDSGSGDGGQGGNSSIINQSGGNGGNSKGSGGGGGTSAGSGQSAG